jgi:methyl-accepting chemotaxis protein
MFDPHLLDHAIAAHSKWKFRLRDAIQSGQSEWTVETVRKDDQCAFGQWLKTMPLADRMSHEWKEARELHTQFHQAAADVLALALSGQRGPATAAMAPGGAFSHVSSQLVTQLTHWKKKLTPPAAK